MIYQKEVLDKFAIYQLVKLELVGGRKLKGFLIPYDEKARTDKCSYILLAENGEKISICRSHIKRIQYAMNGYTLPKEI